MFPKIKIPKALFLLFYLVSLLFLSCTSPKHKIETSISAEPFQAKITLNGRELGRTPLIVNVDNVNDLTKITAQIDDREIKETRVRFLSENHAEVSFHFGEDASPMSKALGLNKILVFDYSDHATFLLNSHELKPDLKPLLMRQAKLLNKYFPTVSIYICGHTDQSGTAEHNLELSLKRAQVVADFLSAQNVKIERLKVQGFGETYPIANNETQSGRTINRRTEIILPQ